MMFSYRLVRLIETHADTLAARLEVKVQTSSQVIHFREIPVHELKERVYEIYRHLGDWYWARTNWISSVVTSKLELAAPANTCPSAKSSRPSS